MIRKLLSKKSVLSTACGILAASALALWLIREHNENRQATAPDPAGAAQQSRRPGHRSSASFPTPEQEQATRNARPCDRTVLTYLDLSRPPSEAELIAAGNLGEPLAPTSPAEPSNIRDPAKRKRMEAVNLSFGTVIRTWNQHRYDEAFALFQKHIDEFPGSPWAAEARLHLGCYCQYKGRLAEAADWFEKILDETPEHSKIRNKAKLRRTILHLDQGHLEDSARGFAEMHRDDPDPRHKSYASYWIREISLFKKHETALRDCGQKSLAQVAEALDRPEEAARLRALEAAGPHGFTAAELFTTALAHGLDPVPVWASGALADLPVPFVAHYNDNHYVTVESVGKGGVRVFDTRTAGATTMPARSFERQWSGFAMLFEEPTALSGIVPATDLDSIVGGCCGLPRHPSDLGDDPCAEEHCGLPGWSVNMVNMNFRVKDTPMWWEPPFGPPVAISLLFNSLDSLNNYTPFGEKWSFRYTSWLLVTPGDNVQVKDGDGRLETFSHPGAGGYPITYTAPPGDLRALVQTAAETYELHQSGGTTYHYGIPVAMQGSSSVPLLLAIEDRHGNSLAITHNANGAITTLSHSSLPAGSDWIFAYTSVTRPDSTVVSRVESISDPFNRSCSFSYDADGNLDGQTDMGGISYSYTYTPSGELFVASITTPKGTTSILTEPSDGVEMIPHNGYPQPGTPMWENYRITVTDPENHPLEYHFDAYDRHAYVRDAAQLANPDYLTPEPVPQNSTCHEFTLVSGKGIIDKVTRGGLLVRKLAEFDSSTLRPAKILDPIADEDDKWTCYTRNAKGMPTEIRLPKDNDTGTTDHTIHIEYQPNGFDVKKVTRKLLGVTKTILEITYFPNSRDIQTVTDAGGRTLAYAWHPNGLPDTVTQSPSGDVITFNYNENTNWRPGGIEINGQTVLSTGYDDEGRLLSVLDANDYSVTYDYDDLNRLRREDHPDNSFVERIWECCYVSEIRSGKKIGDTDRILDRTLIRHDARGLPVRVTDTAGRVTRLSYDAAGRLETLADPSGNLTSWIYDIGKALLHKKTYQDLTEETCTWRTPRHLSSFVSRRGLLFDFTYDIHGNPETITSAGVYPIIPGVALDFTYDTWDRLETATDYYYSTPHEFKHDLLGRITEIDGPWPDDTIQWAYDDALRKTTRTAPGNTSTETIGDAFGRVSTMLDPLGLFTFDYTGQSARPDSILHTQGNANGTPYSGFDTILAWHGDAQRQALESIASKRPGGSLVAKHSYGYDSLGSIDSWQREAQLANPSGPTREYEWSAHHDLGSRLSSVIERSLGGALQGSWHYGFDPAGNITTAQANPDTTSPASISLRGHNNLNQIDTFGGGGAALVRGTLDEPAAVSLGIAGGPVKPARMLPGDRFESELDLQPGLNDIAVKAMDPSGNTTSQTFRVDVAQQASVQFQYDNDGNLLNDGVRTYEWDALSRLRKINWTVGRTTEFIYNALGQRAERIEYQNYTETAHHYYLFDGLALVERRTGPDPATATTDRRYFAQGEQRLESGTWQNYHYCRDHLGSVREVVKWDGTLAARYDFDPYGLRRTEYEAASYATGGPCDHGYTGHVTLDSPVAGQSELCLAHFRAYDPNLGRWLSADPLGELFGTNLYAYAWNDPAGFSDPDGLWPSGVWLGAFFGGLADPYEGGASQYMGDVGQTFAGMGKGAAENLSFGFYDPCYENEFQNAGGVIGDTAVTAMEIAAAGGALKAGAKKLIARRAAKKSIRTLPKNLAEQLTLHEAKGGAGIRIMKGKIKDPRFPEDIWAKMQHVHENPDGIQIVIHYWKNLKTGAMKGYKFK